MQFVRKLKLEFCVLVYEINFVQEYTAAISQYVNEYM